MYKHTFVAAFVALLAVTGSVRSAQAQIDVDLMQAIEDSNKSLASDIATQAVSAAKTDAKELEEMFAKVEDFYNRKGGEVQDAIDLSKKSHVLAQQIQQLVTARNFDAATESAITLSRTCKTCHNYYKKD